MCEFMVAASAMNVHANLDSSRDERTFARSSSSLMLTSEMALAGAGLLYSSVGYWVMDPPWPHEGVPLHGEEIG